MIQRTFLATLAVGLMVAFVSSEASAHKIFSKLIEADVEGIKVTCNTCHIADEPKTSRNPFGELFFEQMSEFELSARWNELEEDREARKAYEAETMTPAFNEAWTAVKAMTNEDGETYATLVTEMRVEGVRAKRSKKKKKKSSGDTASDTEATTGEETPSGETAAASGEEPASGSDAP